MTEVEKLYINAEINMLSNGYCKGDYSTRCPYRDEYQNCYNKSCCYWVRKEPTYPPFTAEKQLELMAFLINTGIQVNLIKKEEITVKAIAEGLACATNEIWHDLTEEEQQQIKEILQ